MSFLITDICPSDNGDYVKIVFSDGGIIRLSSYDWSTVDFARKRSEIDESQYEMLVRIEECSRAKNKLLSLASFASNSRKGFADKLKRYDFSPESIEYALDFAEEKGLISDEVYAEMLARELVENKSYGPIRVKQEMRRHGISDELTKFYTEKYFVPDEKGLSVYDRNMYKLALVKAKGLDLSDIKAREKLFAALNRAGYEYGRISKLKFNKK